MTTNLRQLTVGRRKLGIFGRVVPGMVAAMVGAMEARAEIPFGRGDYVICYGNSMMERLSEQGELEALVQVAEAGKQLRFRSLAWTGDEVGYRLRPEGYEEHMRTMMKEWPARVVVAGYGMNEAFAGEGGLADFREQLGGYLDQLARLHAGAKVVLVGPTAVEPGFPGPDAAGRNADIERYGKVMSEEAGKRGVVYVDVFGASRAGHGRLTTNGLHLNEEGNRVVARVIAGALVGEAVVRGIDDGRVKEVAKAVGRKQKYVAEVVRPKNADLYYGIRKRPEEYAAEMPRYHEMVRRHEAVVHELAATPGKKVEDMPVAWMEPLPPIAGSDDGGATGVIRKPAEAMAEFRVADGYAVNLFASEEEFPELKNPVQIAFDGRGRLWVVTMPSFPHTVPGLPPEDRIVVLEDSDRDGKADRCTTFADGFDALDGIAFTEWGVLVSEQPRLWLMNDTDGDGKADTKREFFRGIDVTDSHHGGMIAADALGHVMFCDGVFHRSQLETPFGVVRGIDATTYRLHPRTGRVESEWQSNTPNPWKITYDRTGSIFQMYGDGLPLDTLALTWTPLGVYHPFSYGNTGSNGKGSGVTSISSPNFPDAYQNGMVTAALLGNYAVSLWKYDYSKGVVRGSERVDVVSSPNAAFRPADVEFGFDGGLYVSDFCSPIIGHAQHAMRDPHWDHGHGRIWRVVSKEKPVVREIPVVEGAGVPELLAFLKHPQNIVRHHARLGLRKAGVEVMGTLDAWVKALDEKAEGYGQNLLEAVFVAEGLREVRPEWLTRLMRERDEQIRAAAVRMVRFQADRLPDALTRLMNAAVHPSPRVQMEVVDAVAHLRPGQPGIELALQSLRAANGDVQHMVDDLRHGTKPALGRSVPVLEVAEGTRVKEWVDLGKGAWRTFVRAETEQPAVLAVRHGYVDILVNGVPMLSSDSMWLNDQQVQLKLGAGLNVIETRFRNIEKPPAVYLYDSLGQRLAKARAAEAAEELAAMAAEYEKAQAALGDAIFVQAVPGRMSFEPGSMTVKAGSRVRLIFRNPDVMLHNLVVLAPGSLEKVGAMADKLAGAPDGLAKGYVPAGPEVLHATPLVQPGKEAELVFTAPAEPGKYPLVCTFPGHWRVMRGVLVVE